MLSIATLSVHRFIDNVGAYVGFGSLIAVALLILLYFAHARETATLRDRLDEAHARIGGLEQRIVALMQTQRARPPAPGAPVPAPTSLTPPSEPRPAGSVIPSVRRIPRAATPAGGAPPVAPPPPLLAGLGVLAPAAPAGMAGPALASATKSIPVSATLSDGAAPVAGQDTMFVAPSTNGGGDNGAKASDGEKAQEAATAPATAAAAATAVAAAAAPRPTASPRGATPTPTPSPALAPGAPAGPPRVQIGGDGPVASARRTVPSSRPSLIEDLSSTGGDHRRMSGRLLPLLIGGVAVVVIIVGLIVITNTGSTTTGTVKHGSSASRTGASVTNHRKHKSPPFVASKFKISVLNGTAVAGLAADVGRVLKAQGFRQGNVTNAAAQTETATVVYYVTGRATASNRTAAQHVASTLKLGVTRVRAATRAVLQSCATSVAGAPLGTCRANVIVSVGTDRADLATSSST